LESCGHTRTLRVNYVNTLPSAELIEVVEVEPLDVLLKQDLTLLQLALEALSISSWSESLPVSVLLMAWSASVGASGASWMFGVALGLKKSPLYKQIAVVDGNCRRWHPRRRHLPLFSCFYIAHTLHEIVGGVLVQQVRHLHRFSSAF
jgi:hypothetical protein